MLDATYDAAEVANMFLVALLPCKLLADSPALAELLAHLERDRTADERAEPERKAWAQASKALRATAHGFRESVAACTALLQRRVRTFDWTTLSAVPCDDAAVGHCLPSTAEAARSLTVALAGCTTHVHTIIGLLTTGADVPEPQEERVVTVVVEELQFEVASRGWDALICRARHGPVDVLAFPLVPHVLLHHDPGSLIAAAITSHATGMSRVPVCAAQLPCSVAIAGDDADELHGVGCAVRVRGGLVDVELSDGTMVPLPPERLSTRPCLYHYREDDARLQPAFFQVSTKGDKWHLSNPAQLAAVHERLRQRLGGASSSPDEATAAFLRAARPTGCRVALKDVLAEATPPQPKEGGVCLVAGVADPPAPQARSETAVHAGIDGTVVDADTPPPKEQWCRRGRSRRRRALTPPSSPDDVAAALTDERVDAIVRELAASSMSLDCVSVPAPRATRHQKKEARKRQMQQLLQNLPDATEWAALLGDHTVESEPTPPSVAVCRLKLGQSATYLGAAQGSRLAEVAAAESWNATDVCEWLAQLRGAALGDDALARQWLRSAVAAPKD